MGLLNMFFTFFKVGLFTIGGGLVAIPIMQNYVMEYQWISEKEFVDMIAISQSTPGPIGINLATFVGASQYGLLGSIVVTAGMVLPSFIIISIVSKFLMQFNDHKAVKAVLASIRPVVVGIILSAAFFIAKVSFSLLPYNPLRLIGSNKHHLPDFSHRIGRYSFLDSVSLIQE